MDKHSWYNKTALRLKFLSTFHDAIVLRSSECRPKRLGWNSLSKEKQKVFIVPKIEM